MNSKQKGSLAVANCIAKLYSLGYEVLLPIGDRMPYDLIFDDNRALSKVQVKFAGLSSRNKYVAGLRITGGNQSFNYVKKYNSYDFDYLYVYTEDNRHFLLKWNEIKVRNMIIVDDEKYKKYQI